jgi:galactose mutarotase-like enzyme
MNNDKVMTPYYAVCLECMFHPNTINSDFLQDKKDILKAGEEYNQAIEYYFDIEG